MSVLCRCVCVCETTKKERETMCYKEMERVMSVLCVCAISPSFTPRVKGITYLFLKHYL